MKFEQPIIELLKIKTEDVAAGILDNPSGADDDEEDY